MPRLPRTLPLIAVLGAALLVAGCSSSTPAPVTATATTGAGASPTSAAAGAYVQSATSVLDALATASDHIATIMQQPDVSSSTWLSSLATALAGFDGLQTRAQQLQAPAAYANAQQQLVDVADEFEQVASLLRSSINPPDAAKLTQAGQTLNDAIQRAAAVKAMLGTS